jgi:serine/threonine protein kinase
MSSVNADDAIDRLVGRTVSGKYRIDRLLGRGGMGAVFQATNTLINKRVALKFLASEAAGDDQAAQRFQREAEAASLVESEHIVHIFDFGTTEEGLPFLVMELLSGRDLRQLLKQTPMLDVATACGITLQLLRALVRAHPAGIVHRDLKPDNVFLCDRDGAEPLVKIVDFGISKLSRKTTLDTLTQRGTILGTAFYMSPEQAQGLEEVDARADLYSVGALLYEMLAGKPPHTAPTYEAVLVAICTRDADDVRTHAAAVPEALARFLKKALGRERSQRFQDASEMFAALEAAAAGRIDPAVEAATVAVRVAAPPGESARASNKTLAAALAALLLGFAVTALLVARSRSSEAELPQVPEAPSVPIAVTHAPPAAERPPPAPGSAVSASPPAPEASQAPVAVKPSVRPKQAPSLASSTRAAAKQPAGSGVAGTLELNTSGP